MGPSSVRPPLGSCAAVEEQQAGNELRGARYVLGALREPRSRVFGGTGRSLRIHQRAAVPAMAHATVRKEWRRFFPELH